MSDANSDFDGFSFHDEPADALLQQRSCILRTAGPHPKLAITTVRLASLDDAAGPCDHLNALKKRKRRIGDSDLEGGQDLSIGP